MREEFSNEEGESLPLLQESQDILRETLGEKRGTDTCRIEEKKKTLEEEKRYRSPQKTKARQGR